MNQRKIDRIISLVDELKAFELDSFDHETIKDYLNEEIEYHDFATHFDRKNPRKKEYVVYVNDGVNLITTSKKLAGKRENENRMLGLQTHTTVREVRE